MSGEPSAEKRSRRTDVGDEDALKIMISVAQPPPTTKFGSIKEGVVAPPTPGIIEGIGVAVDN